jgi:CheY-like chemotaxis protein
LLTVAASGGEAIAAVGEEEFDLVLMDIQMPDMDGYAATAAIGARLGAATPPIVAMTANAMESDRIAAREAGMADHVGKPFDLDQLVAVILRHSRAPDAQAPMVLDAPAAIARLGGDAGIYGVALRGFDAEMDKLAHQLADARHSADIGAAAHTLHTARSLAGMIGANALASAALDAETACMGGADGCWDLVDEVLLLARHARHAAMHAAHHENK